MTTTKAAGDGAHARRQRVVGGLLGLAVGDALGVPVEFTSRAARDRDPVRDMRGFGTYEQPPGTWSDDSSMALCLAESLVEKGVDEEDVARRFVAWLDHGYWTPRGVVFDHGMQTKIAIDRLRTGMVPVEAGPRGEQDNGNGALMRIFPLAAHLARATLPERAEATMRHSALTHGHPRGQLACAFFVELCAALVRGERFDAALEDARDLLRALLSRRAPREAPHFELVLDPGLHELPRAELRSGGYVMETLEAALWCVLRAGDFREAVLEAVNLGEDTDTTGAVAGALAGARFGLDAIPDEWMSALARHEEIRELAERLARAAHDTSSKAAP